MLEGFSTTDDTDITDCAWSIEVLLYQRGLKSRATKIRNLKDKLSELSLVRIIL